jgi:hypothetical protein
MVLVAVLLVGCQALPKTTVVERAIALQFRQTQAELSTLLRPDDSAPPDFRISHVKVSDRQSLIIGDLKSVRVQGTYDVTLTYPDRRLNSRVVQRQNPFEVFLQQQPDGDTWRLAQLKQGTQAEDERWLTTLIQ